MTAEGGGWLRRLLKRPEAGDAEDLTPAAEPPDVGCTRIRDCAEGPAGRRVVRVTGTLRTVTERTVAGMPALHAELDDGSASLEVVWLGRRAIAGVEPGRSLIASGRIAVTRGRPVLFNPRYQLQPREQE
ncbi:OB-fold nucleic acid binding domain-containing protein [Streptomyces litchfieldiae]|uniref:OB-fold nucleic acid binding domain-containing protein n=1 Tax=Streptomyces litchfieldiae TaxID=3075543 RepID=A0ABU2MY70_9ACTN|nr:OB-fold nucleic acid binding domain-containing protein [Streptomyces sp. DSM 44938]MDT0346596.1 OB-fold nucleic acid binding domain-containing protein [Streptomyces sp. DSM 44938]